MTSAVVESLVLDLLEWLQSTERTYDEVMDAWRTSRPRLPVWEDASDRRLVSVRKVGGRNIVEATQSGRILLKEARPSARV